MRKALVRSCKMMEFIMDTAHRAVSAKGTYNRNNIELPVDYNVYRDVAQFIFDIVCEFIKVTNDTSNMDIYFLRNLIDRSWLNITLSKGDVQKYIDKAYSERGFIANRKAPLFLVLIRLYDDKFESTFYEKIFQSIKAIKEDYKKVIGTYHSVFEIDTFLFNYFNIIEDSVNKLLSDSQESRKDEKKENTGNGYDRCGNFYVHSAAMKGEMQGRTVETFDKASQRSKEKKTSKKRAKRTRGNSNEKSKNKQHNKSNPRRDFESDGSCSGSTPKGQPNEEDIYDIDGHNAYVQKYSQEEKQANKKSLIQFLWVVPLGVGIVFLILELFMHALISGIILIICIGVAVSRKSSQCPNCSKLAAMKEIHREEIDRERGIRRKTISENSPVRDAKGHITGYVRINREVIIEVERVTYYVIDECIYCKFRRDGERVETYER